MYIFLYMYKYIHIYIYIYIYIKHITHYILSIILTLHLLFIFHFSFFIFHFSFFHFFHIFIFHFFILSFCHFFIFLYILSFYALSFYTLSFYTLTFLHSYQTPFPSFWTKGLTFRRLARGSWLAGGFQQAVKFVFVLTFDFSLASGSHGLCLPE